MPSVSVILLCIQPCLSARRDNLVGAYEPGHVILHHKSDSINIRIFNVLSATNAMFYATFVLHKVKLFLIKHLTHNAALVLCLS